MISWKEEFRHSRFAIFDLDLLERGDYNLWKDERKDDRHLVMYRLDLGFTRRWKLIFSKAFIYAFDSPLNCMFHYCC